MEMPSALADRWGMMWPEVFWHRRPWWRALGSHIVRVDGVEIRYGTCEDAEAYDGDFPLAAPPPMPGQVWIDVETGCEVMLGCFGPNIHPGFLKNYKPGDSIPMFSERPHQSMRTLCGGIRLIGDPGIFLVAGPTPWGRDIPWAPIYKE